MLNVRTLSILAVVVAAAAFMVNAAFAQAGNSGGTKPGWGYGDKNHVHTGPPGQSVHP
ncbi:MAG TPA: hypothetical protein VEW42_00875 [Candidatus Eisenbacteria bacterium]|nr:hypothetical protein [Candidatus Eisenbacteria bacterium]